MLHGLAFALSERHAGHRPADQGLVLRDPGRRQGAGLPVAVWMLIIVVAVLTVVMRNTPFGFRVREIGSNEEAAEFSGIPIHRIKVMGFLLCGFLAAIAGMRGRRLLHERRPHRRQRLRAVRGRGCGHRREPARRAARPRSSGRSWEPSCSPRSPSASSTSDPGGLEPVRDWRRDPRRGLPRRPHPTPAPGSRRTWMSACRRVMPASPASHPDGSATSAGPELPIPGGAP